MSRPEHNYPSPLRELVLNMAEGVGKHGKLRPISELRIAKFEGAPSVSTITEWRKRKHEVKRKDNIPVKRGPPPLLTLPEKYVIGGWVLERVKKHKIVNIRSIKTFLQENFNIDISDGYVSELMRELDFSSHLVRSVPPQHVADDLGDRMAEFLSSIQDRVRNSYQLSQLVAIDQTSFWNSPTHLRSYSPRGCGQPAVVEMKRTYKDVLYTGLTASGNVITPVLFTSDKVQTGESSSEMPVLYVPKVKGPGNRTTELYFDTVRSSDFSDRPLVLADNLKSYFSKALQEELSDYDITLLHFPSYAGCLLDPCDNAFHADLKRRYYHEERSNHGMMISAIRKAYYDTTEDSIKNYWRHCGYLSKEDPHDVVVRLMGEGYVPEPGREKEFAIMTDLYTHYKGCLRLARFGLTPPSTPVSFGKSKLDGVYWKAWSNKKM